jgi:hypothetical protein
VMNSRRLMGRCSGRVLCATNVPKGAALCTTAKSRRAMSEVVHFCPTCGSTVYWEGGGFPGYVAVAIGSLPIRISPHR